MRTILLTLLIVWVGNGNASLNRKSDKAVEQAKTTPKPGAVSALHFAPFDVVRW